MGVEGGVEQTLGGWSVAGSSELVEKSSKGQTKVEGWRGVAVVAQSMGRYLVDSSEGETKVGGGRGVAVLA